MTDSLGHKAVSGAIWALVDRFGCMGIQFVVNIILARLLLPKDFGIIGMLAIFIAVSQTLVDAGFGNALIQKKKPTEIDYSSVLYWNIAFSCLIYLILFLSAPIVEKFFKLTSLTSVLRGVGLYIILTGIINVQNARLRKNFKFRSIAIISLGSYLIGTLSAIILAYHGYGVWSLVFLQLITASVSIILYFIIGKWRPLLNFSREALKSLFGFGGYMMAASILQDICKNLQGVIIGKKFSATDMGYYSQAYKLDNIVSASIPQVIVQVMYPVYSSSQDDLVRLRKLLENNICLISFIIFPILTILIYFADPLICLIYGTKWLPCVPYYKLLCIGGFFTCLQNINFIAVAALGKSKILFKWSFYKWGFLLAALLIGMNFGMMGIIMGIVLNNFNIWLVNSVLSARYLGWTLVKQLQCLLPQVVLCIVAMIMMFFIEMFTDSWILAILGFGVIYLGFSIVCKIKAYGETISLCVNLLRK